MDIGKKYGVDAELAEGTWVDVGGDGTRLLLAAMPNAKFNKFLEPHRQKYRALGEELPEAIYEEAIAKTVLLDWQNVEHNGVAVEPTETNRLEMLRAYAGFKSLVINQATLVSNFQRRAEDAEIKN